MPKIMFEDHRKKQIEIPGFEIVKMRNTQKKNERSYGRSGEE